MLHAVVLVGYDNTADPPFWIALSSWGKEWGDGGMFRIAFGINGATQLAAATRPHSLCVLPGAPLLTNAHAVTARYLQPPIPTPVMPTDATPTCLRLAQSCLLHRSRQCTRHLCLPLPATRSAAAALQAAGPDKQLSQLPGVPGGCLADTNLVCCCSTVQPQHCCTGGNKHPGTERRGEDAAKHVSTTCLLSIFRSWLCAFECLT